MPVSWFLGAETTSLISRYSIFKSWHLAVIQWVFIHLYDTEFQPTFFPIRKDIFKEEGVGSGSAASGFGNNLWTICAVLKPFGEPSEIPRQMRAKKQREGGFLTREWLGGMGDKTRGQS